MKHQQGETDMAKVLYFSGEIELRGITYMKNSEFAARFPGGNGGRPSGVSISA